MSVPKISVVIAVHNRSHFLKETLLSLQNQTMKEWEALIVDDYSEEDIEEIVSTFKDARFHYIKNLGKKGPSAARNLGNQKATSSLIAVADSDDILLPRRLELSFSYFEENPKTDIFYASIYTFYDGTYAFKNYRYVIPYNRAVLYEYDFVPHVTVVYKREKILAIPYDESLLAAIDYDMVLNFADRDLNFGYLEEPLVLYRRHSEQISTNGSERKHLQTLNTELVRERHNAYLANPLTN